MIRAVLCDLDGVVRLWPETHSARIERQFGLPDGALTQAAFEPALLREATTGAISDEEWRRRISEALAVKYGHAGGAAVAQWSDLRWTVDAEMRDLLRDVRGVVRVALLTNATTRLDADLAADGLADAFDAIANSSALGLVKPDRSVFERAAALVDVPLCECVFIDDQPRHVEAARAAGAAAVLHTSAAETRDALIALGVPLRGPAGKR